MKVIMRILFLAILFSLGVSACSSPPKELKSPCVGLESSPCGKRSANPDRYII